MSLKVLIADDDEGIRLVLRKALKNINGAELVGEASDGEELMKLYESVHPDIVFLDVEMPGKSGVECAKTIADINPKTYIIFVTAHSEYMTEAFELYAFDYLVKPFKVERIHQTMERIKSAGSDGEAKVMHQIIRHEKGLEKLIVKNKDGISLVDKNDIILIQREDRSTVIYTDRESFTTSESLGELEAKLGNTQFLRSHKSYIVNLSMIDKLYPYGRWTYVIKMKNTRTDALLTYEKYQELEQMFSK